MVLKSHEILSGPQNEYATLFTPLDVVVFTPWDVVVSNTSSSNIFEQVISRIFFEISFIKMPTGLIDDHYLSQPLLK